jgi:hypothetical protein
MRRKPSNVIVIDYGRDLFKSKAWLSLTGKASQVYTLFLTKRVMATIKRKGQKKRVCTNCHELEFTYLEAKRYGITKRQFTRAIDQLVEHGLLSVEYTGGSFQRDKSKYGLIDNWQHYGTDNFESGKARKIDPAKRGYRRLKQIQRT